MGFASSLKGDCTSFCVTGARVERDVAVRPGAGNGILWLL